jgi:hypothetical protein
MFVYILLVLIIVLLLYIGKNLERKLDKVEQGIENLLTIFGAEEPQEITIDVDNEEANRKAIELDKMYSEGVMNILTYGSDSRRKKDE